MIVAIRDVVSKVTWTSLPREPSVSTSAIQALQARMNPPIGSSQICAWVLRRNSPLPTLESYLPFDLVDIESFLLEMEILFEVDPAVFRN